MGRSSVKKSQANVSSLALFPGMNYLHRLRERMQKVGFPHNDPLYLKVCAAYDSMHRLTGNSCERTNSRARHVVHAVASLRL